MLDAAPTIPLLRRILKTTYKRLAKKQEYDDYTVEEDVNAGVTNIFEDCWKSPASPELLETAPELVGTAKQHHADLTRGYDLDVELFTGYGKKFLKKFGFNGPEFAQMAIQLASYRFFGGKLVSTYEAALTRTFLHGRTETARPVSPETLAFVEAMGLAEGATGSEDDVSSQHDKFVLLKRAADNFAKYQTDASKGMGVDRHLFGLSCLVRGEDKHKSPDLFSDPLYLRSKQFRLGTSSVIFCPGFGPITDDGIGIGFNIEKDSFMFTCTSRTENQDYTMRFCNLLDEALMEMGDLLTAESEGHH